MKATFAAGCFWHVEEVFRRTEGVVSTRVGYTGGGAQNPTYEQVCTGSTGHAEAVEVTYDPARVSYERLLDVFWSCHDPTTRDRQGPDVGTQYRSAVFCHGPDQMGSASKSAAALSASGRLRAPAVTEIAEAGPFYEAEEYHQQYMRKAASG